MGIKHFALFFLAISGTLSAEVEMVTLKWNPIPCKNSCPILLRERLSKAKGVVNVDVNEASGQANITWDKRVPFSFVPINWALRYVGVREKDLRVRVSGYVKGSGASYSITSKGDNTNFILFNRAVSPDSTQFTNRFNPTNRVLSPDIIAKLDEARQGNRIVTIEGPIFMPERSPPDPLRLVVESISVENPKTTPQQSGSRPSLKPTSFGTSQH